MTFLTRRPRRCPSLGGARGGMQGRRIGEHISGLQRGKGSIMERKRKRERRRGDEARRPKLVRWGGVGGRMRRRTTRLRSATLATAGWPAKANLLSRCLVRVEKYPLPAPGWWWFAVTRPPHPSGRPISRSGVKSRAGWRQLRSVTAAKSSEKVDV